MDFNIKVTASVVVICILGASHAKAAPISIVNAGFEDPTLVEGNYNSNVPGWTLATPDGPWHIGVWNPSDLSEGGAFEGENVVYHNRGSMSQTLSDTLATNTIYTLTVRQKLPASNQTSTVGVWQVDLLAASSPLVSQTGTIASLARDNYVLRTLQFTTGSSIAAGQSLGIRFTLLGTADGTTDLMWDDVQLEANPVIPSTNWGKFPVTEVQNGGLWVDTEVWLGWLEISSSPWVWSVNESNWAYVPESSAEAGSGWVYHP